MISITPTPDDYKATKIYQELEEREKVSRTGLIEKVDEVIAQTAPLLETIGRGTFYDYTLHNPLHSRKLMHLAGYVIPDETMKQLSSLELAVMMMSFYMHDLGMVVTNEDKQKILEDEKFMNYLQAQPKFYERIASLQEEIDHADSTTKPKLEMCLAQVYDAAITDYIRPNHANVERYKLVLPTIKEKRQDLFEYGGSFEEELLLICSSHNNPAKKLAEIDTFGQSMMKRDLFIGGLRLNMQYCAAVLRLVDVLDFDRERTPSSLFKAIGIENKKLPGFKISLTEWNKQMAVHSIVFDDNAIHVNADSTSPSIEQAIKKMCQDVEREVRDTTSFIRNNPEDVTKIYSLKLPLVVDCQVRSRGYVYKDYSIHLNEGAIVNLLMGENLYENAQVAVRELLQNAIDACQVMKEVATGYIPSIRLSTQTDTEGRVWLVVKDNGIGMDNLVLTNYFFKVGNSYYQSTDFKTFAQQKKITQFNPISRFGIGLLSVFMIGDVLKVTTQNQYSIRDDKKLRTLIVDGADSLAVVNEQNVSEQGTTIELRLKHGKDTPGFLKNMMGYVKDNFIRPSAPITIIDKEGNADNIKVEGFATLKEGVEGRLDKEGVEVVSIDFSKYSKVLRGKAHFFFFKKEDGSLSFKDSKGKMQWGLGILKASEVFAAATSGSRMTMKGIKMQMKKIGSLFNSRRNQMACVIDIDVANGEKIEFDVSRSKVVDKGIRIVRKEIFNVVEAAFKERGIFKRFDAETIAQYNKAMLRNKPQDKLNQELLAQVEALIPKDRETVNYGLINEVARQLDLDSATVKGYVYAVVNKRIENKGK